MVMMLPSMDSLIDLCELNQNSVCMRVSGAAAAEQQQVVLANIFNAVFGARHDADRVTRKNLKLVIAQIHETVALGDVIELFGF